MLSKSTFGVRPRYTGRGCVERRLAHWIEERRQAGRGIPIWNEPRRLGGFCGAIAVGLRLDGHVLNMRLISLQSGVRHNNLFQNKTAYDMLLDAVKELGVEKGGMDTPIATDPESGRPWRPRFDAVALAHEERHLQAAAYILCSYL